MTDDDHRELRTQLDELDAARARAEAGAVAARELAAREVTARVAAEARADAAEARVEVAEARTQAAEAGLAGLEATRIIRWSTRPRAIWGRLRRR